MGEEKKVLKKVLAVFDDRIDQFLLRRALEGKTEKIVNARSVDGAIAHLKTTDQLPELVICNHTHGGINAMDLLRDFEKLGEPVTSAVKIVVACAHIMDYMYEQDMDEFIRSPHIKLVCPWALNEASVIELLRDEPSTRIIRDKTGSYGRTG